MQRLDRDIFFHHIMKTAGITVCRFLETVYGRDRSCPLPEHEGADRQPFLDRIGAPHALIVSGHPHHLFDLWDLAGRRAPPRADMTFLRHPVDRFLSCYWFIRRSNYVQRHVSSFDLSLDEALACDDPRLAGNMMTKALASLGRPRDYARPASSEDFPRAVDNLRRMAFVGLVEQFSASIALLGYCFGFEPPAVTDWNVNERYPGRHEIPRRTRQAIMLGNMLDYKLYQYGAELFRLRLAEAGDALLPYARAVKGNRHRYMVRQVDGAET